MFACETTEVSFIPFASERAILPESRSVVGRCSCLWSNIRQLNLTAGAGPFPNMLPMAPKQRRPRKQPAFWRSTFSYWALCWFSQTAISIWTTSCFCTSLTGYWCLLHPYSLTTLLPGLLNIQRKAQAFRPDTKGCCCVFWFTPSNRNVLW